MNEESKPHPDVVRPSKTMFVCELAGLTFDTVKWAGLGALLYWLAVRFAS